MLRLARRRTSAVWDVCWDEDIWRQTEQQQNPDYPIAWRLDRRAAHTPPPETLRVPARLDQLPWNLAKDQFIKLAQCGVLEMCARRAWRYKWQAVAVNVRQLGKRRGHPRRRAPGLSPSTPRGKPLPHGERRRRRHILPFDEQFSLGAAGARQRDLQGFDRR